MTNPIDASASQTKSQHASSVKQPPHQHHVDVAIVGGAMVGATLALGLVELAKKLSRPLAIAVIEAQTLSQDHPGFDARSIAISHGSVMALDQMGVWPLLTNLGTPIHDIHISDRGHFGMTELNRSQFNVDAMGQVVELERVGQVLFKQLKLESDTSSRENGNSAQLQLFCPAKLVSIEPTPTQQNLTLDSGDVIHAKLVVAADGVNSQVRQGLDLPLESRQFGQYGIIANVVTDKPHDHWAWERFTETGPLALLPTRSAQGQHRLSLVWALDEAQAKHLHSASKAEFLQELQQAFGTRAGRFTDVGERHCYPLSLSYMQRPIYHRTVFIGNAAQTLHPIAGQGFNLGLRDVVSLIAAIEKSFSESSASDVDVGKVSVTHHYMNDREQDRRETITGIECMVRGFSNNYWPLVTGRSVGLRLLSWLPMLKYPIARKAMGWRSN